MQIDKADLPGVTPNEQFDTIRRSGASWNISQVLGYDESRSYWHFVVVDMEKTATRVAQTRHLSRPAGTRSP